MSQNSSNAFSDVGGLIAPIGQIGMSHARRYMPIDGSIPGKIFTTQIRKFFDVNTNFVGKKLLKLILPFKQFEWDDEIKRVQLYIPILSFTTLILFSTIVEGINTEQFDPKIWKKIIWIMIISFTEIMVAKFSQNTISHLNIGFLQLTSFVSYRYVPLALLTIILTITNMSIPYLHLLGLVYLLISDTYFCKMELQCYEREVFRQQQGIGSKIALLVHLIATVLISWICNLI